VCVTIALYGRSVTPGWYLHVLAVPLGFTVAVGWRWPALMRWLAAASVLVGACGWVLQLSLFSGCAIKTADKHYDLSAAGCLVDWHQLGVLAMPSTGLVAIVAGAAAALAAIAAAISSPPPAPPARAAPGSH
jgi:hypothetical protein